VLKPDSQGKTLPNLTFPFEIVKKLTKEKHILPTIKIDVYMQINPKQSLLSLFT